MSSSPKLASRSPRSLLPSLDFWFRHFGLSALLVGVFWILHAIWPLAAGGLTSPLKVGLCWGIVGLCVVAAFDAAHTLAILDVNRALAQFLVTAGEAKLRDMRANPANRPQLESLSSFLPQNPSRPAIVRMFQHVLDEARDREFGSSSALVQVYRESILTRYQRIDRLQQLALRLGILGTFIGLAEALHVVPAGLQALLPLSDAAEAAAHAGERQHVIIEMGQGLIRFLADAFGTSIVGLASACGIWCMTFVLRRELTTYLDAMERSADVSLALVRNALNESDFQEAFERLIQRLDELKRHLFDRVAKLGESVDRLQGRVEAQTETMADAVVALQEGAAALQGKWEAVSSRQGQLAQQFENVIDKAGFDSLFQRIENAVREAGKSVGADFGRELAGIARGVDEMRTTLAGAPAAAAVGQLPSPSPFPSYRGPALRPPPLPPSDSKLNMAARAPLSSAPSTPVPNLSGAAVVTDRFKVASLLRPLLVGAAVIILWGWLVRR